MSHELDVKADGTAAMMYYGEKPWHGMGTELNEPTTSEAAIVAAGLDWEVKVFENLYARVGSKHLSIPNRKVTVRMDRKEILGVVGNRYHPIQNREAFQFFDSIVADGEAIYHTAGSLFEGRHVWILAKLPGTVIIADDDNIEKYLLLTNAHDGTGAITVKFTPVRVVCANTLSVALSHKEGTSVHIRHTANAYSRLEMAKKTLGIATVYYEKIGVVYQDMQQFSLKDALAKKYFKDVVSGESTRAENVREQLFSIYKEDATIKGTSAENTAWGAYNAVTHYTSHEAMTRSINQQKFDQAFYHQTIQHDSTVAVLRQRAYDTAVELIK